MAIDFIWARKKRKETIQRRSRDEIRYHRAVYGVEAHAVVRKKLARCEKGSDDAAILRKAERALRPPMFTFIGAVFGGKKSAIQTPGAQERG